MKNHLLSLFATLVLLTGLVTETQASRNYDPEIGRFMSIDPILREKSPMELQKLHGGRLLSDSPYSYSFNNPVRYVDPDGRTPWDLLDFAFAAMSVSDAIKNPTASNIGWAVADVAAAALPLIPSTKGVRMLLNAGEAAVDGAKAAGKVGDGVGEAGKIKNPFGSKGKPDHQSKVGELKQKAVDENPGMEIVTEQKIRVDGSNRRPDVQVVDPHTGNTTKVYEAERRPNSARNKKREAEYDKMNISHETHKVGGN
jgi:RHS repeat-associated protein